MRVSSRAIIIKDDKVALIYREGKIGKYYVFPGGGQEIGETKEDCVIRECFEELGITVSVIKQLYEVKGDNVYQNFYLCNWESGEFGTGDGEEYNEENKSELYEPIFVKISEIKDLNIISPEIKNQFLIDYKIFKNQMDNNIKNIYEKGLI